MDSRTFLGLEPTHNPFRWKLPVTEGISTTGNFLFGGSGLGAAISAMEGTSDRQCVWATAQYLSYAKPGEVVDIDVTVAVSGHQITQVSGNGCRRICPHRRSAGHAHTTPTGPARSTNDSISDS